MREPRYVIVHGHFYQPPRESPWTGLIAPEPSAAPFKNWNERILSECYTANAHAHLTDGVVAHIRNNYESLNFDVGPTLAAWLQLRGPTAYRSMVRGDAKSRERHDGHGNAIAQSYNHSILPLLSPRNRELQIAWGIEDFEHRFGRKPEGIWLPECAVDEETLELVAGAGPKFTILAPEQGTFNGGVHPRAAGPFLWRSGDSTVAVFRFDRELSHEISFNSGLMDGGQLAEWIAATLAVMPEGSALMLATDGETFGHHKKTGATGLARTFSQLEEREGLVVTNCEDYLATRGVSGTFASERATSWSCPHGVERWRSNCGCRADGATSQEWRGPLHDAMEFVTNHAEAIYDRLAPALVNDPAGALRSSIRLMIDPNPAVHEEFFARFKVSDETKRNRLMRLFEMERAAQACLTSCAWFFDDFGGLEGRIALRWAARTIELAAERAPSIEPELLARLREIKSNRIEIGDAATLYLSLKTREARGRA